MAEIGGELIDTQHSTMRSYARQFGLELEVMEDPSLEPRYYIDGQFYDEAEVVEEVRAFIPAMNRDLQSLTSPDPENATDADRALDYTTLADYLETRGAGHVARAVIDSSYTGEYGLEIAEQSALNLLLFMHADRRSKFTPFGQFSDEKYHVIGGNGQIAHGLAGRIGGGALRYGHSLVAARHRADGAVVLTFDTAGGAVEHVADAVIFAVPFTVLRRVDLSGLNLPAFKRRAIDELIYGTNAKVM
ncbi:MAG: FAD-dependent oxidoreductase, partial [Myxococcales bacterium]|nr:FAD-dependent oxidoreductase [Myxococcales bacterium]